METRKVDLRECKKGDLLISSRGAKLEYIASTPWRHYTYLDHVVRYIEDKDGESFGEENYGTRTHDGYTFAKNRKPETDHDIVQIIKQQYTDIDYKKPKQLSMKDILVYEVVSHWLASKISNPFLQELFGKYFAWKVSRKYRRYQHYFEIRKSKTL